MNLFKWIDELFTKKRPWDSFSEEEQKKFSPFMVNRYLSMSNDFLPIVNHFQKLTIEVMPHSAAYKFYCSLLPNKKTVVYRRFFEKVVELVNWRPILLLLDFDLHINIQMDIKAQFKPHNF